MEGAILLSRAIIDSEVFASEKMLKIWVWLLIRANFKENYATIRVGAGQIVVPLKRGQVLFGRYSAEKELGISSSTIYKCVKRLRDIGNIQLKSSSHYTIITICNYARYQDFKNYKEQPKNYHARTEEQHGNNTVSQRTNVNNVNNDREEKFHDLVFSFKDYPEDLLTGFFNYWSEKSKSGKMRWEMEKTYEIKKRLIAWAARDKKFSPTKNSKEFTYNEVLKLIHDGTIKSIAENTIRLEKNKYVIK